MGTSIPDRTIRGIECWGEWRWDSNCIVLGYDEEQNEIEEIYADGGDSWDDVVNKLSAWADDNGITLIELQAC